MQLHDTFCCGSTLFKVGIGLTLGLTGCQKPFNSSSPPSLEQTLRTAIARELTESLAEAPASATAPESAPETTVPSDRTADRVTTRPESPVISGLEARKAELDRLTPWGDGRDANRPKLDLGADLEGQPQQRVEVTLEQVVTRAVRQNLAIQAARLLPAIRAEDVIAAEAVFDAIVFANADYSKLDEPRSVTIIGGVPLGTPVSKSESWRFDTGISKRFSTGTVLTASTDVSRFSNLLRGVSFSPDPAYTSAVRLGVTQSLLRGFGDSANMAVVRLSRNDKQRSIEDVRIALLRLADETEAAYWDLVKAWTDLGIAEWLVDVGIQVRDVLERRRDFDASLAEYSDAVARVEQRRAEVIRARRAVREASDRLKQLMNDSEMSLAGETVLMPTNELLDQPITYNLRESLLTAIENRPEIDRAGLAISDSDIRIAFADNERLPALDLNAQAAFLGLDDSLGSSYGEIGDSRFVDYVLGLAFEYPLGNRGANANYRRSRLERSAAILFYRQTLQEVVLDVKTALRSVIANYELIGATRSFRTAQAENLRALMVEEETLAGLTPEFLNLKFQRQETLASARRQEIDAIASFDKAVSSLYRAMGTGLSMKNIEVEVVDENPPADAGMWGDTQDWPR